MKYIIVGLLIILLTGCGCFSVVSCVTKDDFTDMSYIQAFQYKETVGRTDKFLRKEAFYNCGISREVDLDNPHWHIVIQIKGKRLSKQQCYDKYHWVVDFCEDLEDKKLKMKKLETCLKSKGYIEMDCGTKAKPTGFCN